MKEEIYYVVDSLGVANQEVIERPAMSIARLYVEGGAGFMTIIDVVHMIGDVSLPVICGGLKVTLITTFYGLIVYFISLIIRVIQKPRI